MRKLSGEARCRNCAHRVKESARASRLDSETERRSDREPHLSPARVVNTTEILQYVYDSLEGKGKMKERA